MELLQSERVGVRFKVSLSEIGTQGTTTEMPHTERLNVSYDKETTDLNVGAMWWQTD